tara:strand:- start:757 stop:1071 length:315 start_codon:yes stop_codon:yes gene_type:complete
MPLDATSPVYGKPWFASSPVYGEDDRYGGEGFSPAYHPERDGYTTFDGIEPPLTAIAARASPAYVPARVSPTDMATLKPIEHPGAYTQPGINTIARPTAMYATR